MNLNDITVPPASPDALPPTATVDLGIFGGGQLGRMLAMAALPLGVRCSFFDPAGDQCPAASLGPVFGSAASLPASSTDPLQKFAQSAPLFTYEFENIDPALVRSIAQHKPVMPGLASLELSRHRWEEKSLFTRLGIPGAAWRPISSLNDLSQAVRELGLPVVLKTATQGYDGKGQCVLRAPGDLENVWEKMAAQTPLIAEQWIAFQRELSLIAVRSRTGDTVFYPLVENTHHHGILSHTLAPAPRLTAALQQQAEDYCQRILQHTQHTGVLTLELFELDQQLLANEMAPRVHNSGHWSIEGAHCSQFENHIRALMGWPLGSTDCQRPTAMINLIGRLPDLPALLAIPELHVHLYGKTPRPGRKLGHLTLQADSLDTLQERMQAIGALLPEPLALIPVETKETIRG